MGIGEARKHWSDHGPGQLRDYMNYGHAVAMPGLVLSSKTGNTFTPKLIDLGKKKPVQIRRQSSGGVAGRGGQQSFFGQTKSVN